MCGVACTLSRRRKGWSAGSGSVSWAEAWEVARPWFVDPDAKSFTQTSAIPGEWFQGEYDLVYRWSGSTRIVDLKASIGRGDRSGSYLDQLRMYGWLWWETHERAEEAEALEIWYLGTGTVKDVPRPSAEEMSGMSENLERLYQTIHAQDPDMAECPPNPSPLRFFDDGGVPSDPPVHPDERARCERCDYRGFCEGSDHDIALPLERRIERFGHAWPVTPISEIQTPIAPPSKPLSTEALPREPMTVMPRMAVQNSSGGPNFSATLTR